MLKITALDHIVLNVRDIDAALAFYVDGLGLAPERLEEYRRGDAPFPSVRVNEQTIIDLFAEMHSPHRATEADRANDKFLKIFGANQTPQQIANDLNAARRRSEQPSHGAARDAGRANLNHFCLVVDAGIGQVAEHFNRIGARFENIQSHLFGARGIASSIYIRDPDGNTIELRSYREPAPATVSAAAAES